MNSRKLKEKRIEERERDRETEREREERERREREKREREVNFPEKYFSVLKRAKIGFFPKCFLPIRFQDSLIINIPGKSHCLRVYTW